MSLIYDRTSADVERVAALKAKWLDGSITDDEKAEWLAGLKGAYNAKDLNRVGQFCNALAKALGVGVAQKTDWAVGDIPTEAQITAYLANIAALQDASVDLKAFLDGLGVVIEGADDLGDRLPDTPGFDHEGANALECVLSQGEIVTSALSRGWLASGEIAAGET